MNITAVRKAINKGQIKWRKHALQRLAERNIAQKTVFEVLSSGQRIEDYPDDKPYPSALFLAFVSGEPLHVLAAFDRINQIVYIVTAYKPTLEVFEKDYKTRRKHEEE